MNREDAIISQIEHSLREYDLRDIKLISKQNTVIASFILCSCFIEHLCTFRYGMIKDVGRKEFGDFVKEYLIKYDAEKLRTDLRNRLVHNYSLGESYVLVMGYPNLHLQDYGQNQKFLNLENFINDLEDAFEKYINELKANKTNLRDIAVAAYRKVKIIGLQNQNS